VDGIILLNTHDGDRGLAEVVEARYPLVVIGTLSNPHIPQVDIDNYAAAREVARYLVGLGHRRIAMILHASPLYYAARQRRRGYQDALKEAGLEPAEEMIEQADFTDESGYDAMVKLLALSDLPTAVFAGNDTVAYGAVKAIRDADLAIPQDISLAGFDDDFLSRYLNPPLTTMSLPAPSLGAEAARLLIQVLGSGEFEQRSRMMLTAHLVIRASCGSPPGVEESGRARTPSDTTSGGGTPFRG